ncbi:MMPL family transporter [Miltoncostaea marina]|uniref:MMPL family transporter n=1 Tax=Miltoncostaea marina TaxID=2843215 RepID=UPI001C3D0CAB|nr:MMPL family transporter [Miltoncostaea marina]
MEEGRRGGVAGGLTRAIVALRHVVVLAWIAAAVAAVVWLPPLGGSDGTDLPLADDAPPLEAERRSAETFGAPLIARTQVVVSRPEGLTAEEHAELARFAVAVTRGEVQGFEEVAAAIPVPSAGALAPGAQGEPASVLTYLLFDGLPSIPLQVTLGERYLEQAPVPDGATAALTGSTPARDQQLTTIEDRMPWVVLITLALIVVVVALVFRSPVAPLVVLGAAAVAYVVDLRVIAWVGERTGIAATDDIEPVVSALLLGIVTDYALFYLFTARSRLRAGEDARGAAAGAGAHVMAIVMTAGLITALGTASLLVGRLDFFRAFAPALALTALVSVAVAVTLLPALLAILGRAAFWPGGAREEDRPLRHRAPLATRLLTTRGVAAGVALLVLGGLGTAAYQVGDMRLGLGLTSGLASGAEAAAAGFAPGVTAPTEVLIEGPGATDPATLERLGDALAGRPGVADVLGPGDPLPSLAPEAFVDPTRSAARLALVLDSAPTEHRAIEHLEAIERELPAMLADAGAPAARASLAGDTAIASASIRAMEDELLRVGAAALVVNLLLLALFLRALVAPLYLLVANALSVAATLGIATLVFQDLLDQGQLVYYVPFASAVLLLALGSDYNVFLVGGIWRAAERHGIVPGIRSAMPQASFTITVAGLVLAGSFAMLAVVPVDALRQLAFVMGLGIAIDAFVVRPLLVPALITLFGRAGFWPGERPRTGRAEDPVGAGAEP